MASMADGPVVIGAADSSCLGGGVGGGACGIIIFGCLKRPPKIPLKSLLKKSMVNASGIDLSGSE